MIRTLIAFASLVLVGCAPVFQPTKIDPAQMQADMMKQMAAMQSAKAAAAVKCAPLQSREVPWPEERYVGSLMATRVMLKRPLIDQPELTERVALVGRLIASRSSRPSIPWTFGVVKSATPEVFTLPGGYVFLTSALVSRMHNEAELAGVLSREIAHVAAGDPTRFYRDVTARQCEASVMVAALAESGMSSGSSMFGDVAKFAKDFTTPFNLEKAPSDFQLFLFEAMMGLKISSEESDADKTGTELTANAGYDVAEFESFLTRLDGEPTVPDAFGKPIHEGYLAFKPKVADRVARLKAQREGDLAWFSQRTAKPPLPALKP